MIETTLLALIVALDRNTAALQGCVEPTEAALKKAEDLTKIETTVAEARVAETAPKKTTAKKAAAPTPPPEPEKTPEPETPKVPTVAELRGVAQTFLDKGGAVTSLKAINEKYGQKKIGDTTPENASAVFAAIQALIDGLATSAV